MIDSHQKILFKIQLGDEICVVLKFKREGEKGNFRLGSSLMILERTDFIEDVHITLFLEPNQRQGGYYTPHLTVKYARNCKERHMLAKLAPQQFEAGFHAMIESTWTDMIGSLHPVSLTQLEKDGWRVAAVCPKVLDRWIRRSTSERPSYKATLETVCALSIHAMRNARLPSDLQCLATQHSPCVLFRFEGEQLVTETLFWFPNCDQVDGEHPLSKFAATSGYGSIRNLGSQLCAGIERSLPPPALEDCRNLLEPILATCSRKDNIEELSEESRVFVTSLMPIFGHFAMTLVRVALGKKLGILERHENCPLLLI